MSYRDSNQGACTNACRCEYKVNEAEQNMEGDIVLKNPQPALSLANDGPSYPELPIVDQNPLTDEVFLLEEAGRQGDLMPAYEDEHGTYIMNSKDLRAIQHVKTFCDMGMSSLKIEGRTKSFFYAARTAQVYRRAIDDAVAGKEFDGDLMTMLDSLSNRGYTDAFYSRHMPNELQTYEHGRSVANQQKFVGDVIEVDNDFLTVEVKNKFEVGEEVELMTPVGNVRFTLNQMFDVKGTPEEVAPGSGHFRKIPLEGNVPSEIREALQGHAGEFALLMKFV